MGRLWIPQWPSELLEHAGGMSGVMEFLPCRWRHSQRNCVDVIRRYNFSSSLMLPQDTGVMKGSSRVQGFHYCAPGFCTLNLMTAVMGDNGSACVLDDQGLLLGSMEHTLLACCLQPQRHQQC